MLALRVERNVGNHEEIDYFYEECGWEAIYIAESATTWFTTSFGLLWRLMEHVKCGCGKFQQGIPSRSQALRIHLSKSTGKESTLARLLVNRQAYSKSHKSSHKIAI